MHSLLHTGASSPALPHVSCLVLVCYGVTPARFGLGGFVELDKRAETTGHGGVGIYFLLPLQQVRTQGGRGWKRWPPENAGAVTPPPCVPRQPPRRPTATRCGGRSCTSRRACGLGAAGPSRLTSASSFSASRPDAARALTRSRGVGLAGPVSGWQSARTMALPSARSAAGERPVGGGGWGDGQPGERAPPTDCACTFWLTHAVVPVCVDVLFVLEHAPPVAGHGWKGSRRPVSTWQCLAGIPAAAARHPASAMQQGCRRRRAGHAGAHQAKRIVSATPGSCLGSSTKYFQLPSSEHTLPLRACRRAAMRVGGQIGRRARRQAPLCVHGSGCNRQPSRARRTSCTLPKEVDSSLDSVGQRLPAARGLAHGSLQRQAASRVMGRLAAPWQLGRQAARDGRAGGGRSTAAVHTPCPLPASPAGCRTPASCGRSTPCRPASARHET